MDHYKVRHLASGKEFSRPWVLHNPHHTNRTRAHHPKHPDVEAFHRTLPDYNETPLHDLSSIAQELGVAHVFLKDESSRFGLPAFKILGASWATHQAACNKLGISPSTSLRDLQKCLLDRSVEQIRLVTCSEGNWGRACARMAKILGVEITVYVPGFMSDYTQNLLRGEGAEVRVLKDGSYDDCIAATIQDAEHTSALMVMDTAWEGYEEIPQWVTDGYSTMLTETDRQVASVTSGVKPNTFFVSVGVGSWAHSVVAHYKAASSYNCIIAVEPDTAASLKESLHVGSLTPIQTGDTIMAGTNCGTTSELAWPVLKHGVTSAVTVTDHESHECVEQLQNFGVSAGPCGAATLAALRKYAEEVPASARQKMVIVLFSTEGRREYHLPS